MKVRITNLFIIMCGLVGALACAFAEDGTSKPTGQSGTAGPAATDKSGTAKTDQSSPADGENDKGKIKAGDEKAVVAYWPLAFRSADAPGYIKAAGTSVADPSAKTSEELAKALNFLFADVFVKPVSDGLLIVGPRERVRRVKIALAKWIDVPYPQVRMQVWAFQSSSKGYSKQVGEDAEIAEAGIKLAREFLRAYVHDMTEFVRNSESFLGDYGEDEAKRIAALFDQFHLLGKDNEEPARARLNRGRREIMPFIDQLTFIGMGDMNLFAPRRKGVSAFQNYVKEHGYSEELLDAWEERFGNMLKGLEAQPPALDGQPMSEGQAKKAARSVKALLQLCRTIRARAYNPPFPNFSAVMASSDETADREAILRYMEEYAKPSDYAEATALAEVYDDRREGGAVWELNRLHAELRSLQRMRNVALNTAGEMRSRILELQSCDSLVSASSQRAIAGVRRVRVAEQASRLELELKKKKKELDADKNNAKLQAEVRKIELESDKAQAEVKLCDDKIKLCDEAIKSVTDQTKLHSENLVKVNEDLTTLSKSIENKEGEIAVLEAKLLDLERREAESRGKPHPKDGEKIIEPERLTILAANVDEMIKNATDSFCQDVESAVLDPLASWVAELGRGHKDGLALTGKVGLSVTSSMGAASAGESQFYAPYTPQQTLSKDSLKTLLDYVGGVKTVAIDKVRELLETVAGFAGGAPMYVPIYSTVAPGLDLAVRPSVLPGAYNARLLINFRANAEVTDPNPDRKRPEPIDLIKSHETRTDVAVNAFDLFPLSTFSVETTTLGDPQWRIYGLEGIPILGNMFIGPRRPVTSVGRSLVIVYTTILPRSLDITRRYSGD